ncbi:fumA [Symbiodinium natans]|uniref:FumA protein n=1 Tax=Symbiodinium natans TaxID=878477 RepID=A0A812KQJ2_9DINO|nr:fumA [Symbiodinium natans]
MDAGYLPLSKATTSGILSPSCHLRAGYDEEEKEDESDETSSFSSLQCREREKVDDLLKEEEKETEDYLGAMTPSFSLSAPEAKDEDIETGHEREAPGAAPWRIFRNMTLATCFFWICAGAWEFMAELLPELIDMGLAFEDEIEAQTKHSTQLNLEHVRLQPVDAIAFAGEHRASLMALRTAVKSAHYEQVNITRDKHGETGSAIRSAFGVEIRLQADGIVL